MIESLNDNRVCRTDPATPGQSITMRFKTCATALQNKVTKIVGHSLIKKILENTHGEETP